jgi:hypothetical protein
VLAHRASATKKAARASSGLMCVCAFRLCSNGVLDQSGLVLDYTTPHVVKCTHLLSRLSRLNEPIPRCLEGAIPTEMIHWPMRVARVELMARAMRLAMERGALDWLFALVGYRKTHFRITGSDNETGLPGRGATGSCLVLEQSHCFGRISIDTVLGTCRWSLGPGPDVRNR